MASRRTRKVARRGRVVRGIIAAEAKDWEWHGRTVSVVGDREAMVVDEGAPLFAHRAEAEDSGGWQADKDVVDEVVRDHASHGRPN